VPAVVGVGCQCLAIAFAGTFQARAGNKPDVHHMRPVMELRLT